MIIHVVQPGETIDSIAESYGVSAERLIQDNELTNPNNLVVGQTIVVVYPSVNYTAKAGDTLKSIADAYGVTPIQLLRNNPEIADGSFLYVGETIVINYNEVKIGSISTNGYAYPLIDQRILRKTLPYLTYLTIFTYGFTPEGELIKINDTKIIQIAKAYGVAPLMLISTLTSAGIYSFDLAHTILSDQESQNRLISNIILNMEEKGYYGLSIDFEYILPEDNQEYVNFVSNVTSRLNKEGYEVVVSLDPKNTTDQPGVIYEQHDYAGLGQASNFILLMTYEWNYTFGEPMAAAPNNIVRKILDYTVTQIPSNKTYMGIPNFGYDWIFPFVRGISRAESIGNVPAVELAAVVGAAIEYDEVSQAPFYYYIDYNTGVAIQHVVWFEDARSIDAKLKLVTEYKLKGIGIWNIMLYFPQMWLVINSQYDIDKVLLI